MAITRAAPTNADVFDRIEILEQKKYSASYSSCDTIQSKVLLYAIVVFLKKWA